jgi:hypothetical protein
VDTIDEWRNCHSIGFWIAGYAWRSMSVDQPTTPFERARVELRRLGVELISAPGSYRFRYVGQDAAAPYLVEEVDDLAQAIEIGRELAKHAPPAPPAPLGPMGHGPSRRGAMIRHNRKIAARRQKQRPKSDGTS